MRLTDYEKRMLDGQLGEMKQQAMQALYDLAVFYDVGEFVEVVGCHDDSTVYAGEAQVAFAEYLADHGAKFAVPTTTNATACDINLWNRQKHNIEVMAATKRIEAAHIKMGAIPTWSCAPYHVGVAPSFGQQFASAESNVICYYNSVIGARTNRYAEGLVKLGDDIKSEYFVEEDIYNLVSYSYGSIVADRIWALEGIPAKGITNEIMKQFSATAASSGGIALYHMIGVTPEAQTKEQAFGGKKPKEIVEIHLSDLAEAERQLTNPDVTDIDAIVLGCPHCSYNECAKVAELLHGRKIHDNVQFWLITPRSVAERIKDSGLYEQLIRSGIEIYSDGCILEYRNDKLGTRTMMSNSGKFDTYCFSMRGLQPVFGSMRECVESAVAGKVVREAKPWRK